MPDGPGPPPPLSPHLKFLDPRMNHIYSPFFKLANDQLSDLHNTHFHHEKDRIQTKQFIL